MSGVSPDEQSWIEDAYEALGGRLRIEMLEKDLVVKRFVSALSQVGRHRGIKLVFAGGTSLSQAHGVLQRMSEDVDFRVMLPDDLVYDISKSGIRRVLSALRDEVIQSADDAGFPLVEGSRRSRNENRYTAADFAYQSSFSSDAASALRPTIKLELVAFEPVLRKEYRPLSSIVERVSEVRLDNRPIEAPVVPVDETTADKIVGYLRRTAADAAGEGRGTFDERLVRHLYDVWAITEAVTDDGFLQAVTKHVASSIERDRATYRNQFTEFRDAPQAVLRGGLDLVWQPETRQRYERFCETMIYGDTPAFDTVAERFVSVANGVLPPWPGAHDPLGEGRHDPAPSM